MEHLKENMSEKSKRLLQLSTDKGVSNWFTMSPIAKYGFEFSKQQFWEYICLRYGWEISKLPTTCPCGNKFDIQHSMSCKKGGFVTIRHNELILSCRRGPYGPRILLDIIFHAYGS